MTISTLKWTIDHYHQAIEAGVFDDVRIELLNGELVEMPIEGVPHAGWCSSGGDYLRRQLRDRAIVRDGHPVTLPGNSEPEPDLAIVERLDDSYIKHHPYPEDIFGLIEYSEFSLEKDLKLKTRIYAELIR